MTMSAPIDVLALSPKQTPTSTSELLADAARARGLRVLAADQVPAGARAAYCTAARCTARRSPPPCGVGLLVPPEDFLESLPPDLLGR